MSFIDWLIHTCTIKRAWTTKDEFWVEHKDTQNIYCDIKCRKGKGSSRVVSNAREQEHFTITYKLYVEACHWWAIKWDRVIIDWEKFIIFWKSNPSDNSEDYIIYNITIDEQP